MASNVPWPWSTADSNAMNKYQKAVSALYEYGERKNAGF